MYKKVTLLTACVAATALLLAVSLAQAADPADEGGEGGGSTASAAEMPDICKAQAAKRNLTGSEAEDISSSARPRSATPKETRRRLTGARANSSPVRVTG